MSLEDRNFLLTVSQGNITLVKQWITLEQRLLLENWLNYSKLSIGAGKADIVNVIAACCAYFLVQENLLYTPSRTQQIKNCRQMCMYIIHKYLGLSSAAAGRIFRRDHATVLHAGRAVETKMRSELGIILSLLGLQMRATKNLTTEQVAEIPEPVHV